MEYQVIIHAGGKGTRLLPLTLEKPKPLLEVDDKTLIEHSIQPFLTAGFTKFIITASYKSEMIKEFLTKQGINSIFIEEKTAAGRAGAIRLGIEQGLLDPNKPTITMHCDDIIKINIKDFIQSHEKAGVLLTLGLSSAYQNPFGVVNTENGKVISFIEKPPAVLPEGQGINTGIAIFSDLKLFVNVKIPSQPEYIIYPKLAEQGQIHTYFVEDWCPVNTKDQLKELQQKLAKDK